MPPTTQSGKRRWLHLRQLLKFSAWSAATSSRSVFLRGQDLRWCLSHACTLQNSQMRAQSHHSDQVVKTDMLVTDNTLVTWFTRLFSLSSPLPKPPNRLVTRLFSIVFCFGHSYWMRKNQKRDCSRMRRCVLFIADDAAVESFKRDENFLPIICWWFWLPESCRQPCPPVPCDFLHSCTLADCQRPGNMARIFPSCHLRNMQSWPEDWKVLLSETFYCSTFVSDLDSDSSPTPLFCESLCLCSCVPNEHAGGPSFTGKAPRSSTPCRLSQQVTPSSLCAHMLHSIVAASYPLMFHEADSENGSPVTCVHWMA